MLGISERLKVIGDFGFRLHPITERDLDLLKASYDATIEAAVTPLPPITIPLRAKLS